MFMFLSKIIDLHHDIFFFLILIFVFVSWILVRALWHFHYKKNPIPQRIVHGTTIEILWTWTIFPSIILMFIAIPSFALLYSMDASTIKAIGHQWYWTYEYSDYNSSNEQSLTFDSYTIPEDDLELGQLRLLEVDNRVVVPEKTHLSNIITHAVPSLGVKCDAVPGPGPLAKTLDRLGGVATLVYCEALRVEGPPASPEVPTTPPVQLPVPEQPRAASPPTPPIIPQRPPLLTDEARRDALYNRYLLLNLGGDASLTRMVSIIDSGLLLERHIESALIADGYTAQSILANFPEIRGIISAPRGRLLTAGTLNLYLTQIREQGTRQSLPYRRIMEAIHNYVLLLERRR